MTLPAALYTDRQRWGLLAILFVVSTSNYLDRTVIAVLLDPIKREFHVSDTMLGLLTGFSFAAFYALFGLPVARWADRGNRRTIITLALATWSIATVFCGLAPTFWLLALSRVGVGAGESGAIPPAQSLIVDYFPPERRASAIAVFTAAGMAGYLLGFGLGGYIAAEHGWRMTFLVVGASGLVLAVATRLGLSEPRTRLGFPGEEADRERFRQSVARLSVKRSFLYALAGCLLYFFMAYGVLLFIPSFLIRLLHIPLATVGTAYGSVSAVGNAVGTLGGGPLADRWARQDIRWLAWLPAAACLLTGPIYAVAFATNSFPVFLILGFVAAALLGAGLPAVFAAVHAICGSRRRATAVAIVLFSATLFGGGFGPLTTGAVSDAFGARYGADGLRYSLMLMTSVLLVAGGLFYLFGRKMPLDLED